MKPYENNRLWVGFDLDDTLHDFKHSSGLAVEKVINHLSEHSVVPAETLLQIYKEALASFASNAFVSGHTSDHYRSQRFSYLVDRAEVSDSQLVSDLLGIYDQTINDNLTLNDSVIECLRELREFDLRIAVITEGPHDAQTRAISSLGLSGYVNMLITSNMEKISKTEGLFGRALEILNCRTDELVYVGDSFERDILAASQANVATFWYCDDEVLAAPPGIPTKKFSDFRQLPKLVNDHFS